MKLRVLKFGGSSFASDERFHHVSRYLATRVAQGEKLVLNCRGEIVRVEVEGAKVGLAVKTRTSVLKP